MSEYDESTEWTGHYGSWLQSRGLKRTTDHEEAFHAGYMAQKDEVTRLRAENAELRKLVDLHINTKIVAERVATNFIDRVQKERDELRAQIAEYKNWFGANASVLATHRIGGYEFAERMPGEER